MAEKSVLFISNGYGEDTIATSIIKCMKRKVASTVMALPLVGEGRAYEKLGCDVIGPRRLMPSGGMIPESMGNLVKDLLSGLGRLTFEQIRVMRQIRKKLAVTVAVGDIYPVILSAFFSKRPLIMIGTAKSDYFYRYNMVECLLMRHSCSMVFTRDDITAESLRSVHIGARWVGNAMMDSLEFSGEDFESPSEHPCVGILPGSRSFAYQDIVVLMGAVEEMWKLLDNRVFFLMALADSTDVEMLARSTEGSGWRLSKNENSTSHIFEKEGLQVHAVKGKFGDVLRRSTIVVGQAGTGNEQAVGLGKPVVTFDSSGRESLGWYRRRQKGLLGDSISVVQRDKSSIAREACVILKDQERYRYMQKLGYERMGPSGAAEKIATYLAEQLEQR